MSFDTSRQDNSLEAYISCRLIPLDSRQDNSLEAYINCRLIPLDKKSGVRPIVIGEVVRRITWKAIISVIKSNNLNSAADHYNYVQDYRLVSKQQITQ